MEEKIGKGLGWLDKALTIVDKYKFKTIFKGIFLIVIIAAVIGFLKNPTWVFEQYQIWAAKQHTIQMDYRAENDAKMHNLVEKLNYRTNSSRVMILEFHNGTESVGGLPFRKCSATYEAINVGVMPVAQDYNEINLSLIPFATYMKTQGYWCGNTDEIEGIDRAFCYKLKSSGIEHFAACTIEGVDKPLAILIVGYDSRYTSHECEKVRENIRHCALEFSLLLELNHMADKK